MLSSPFFVGGKPVAKSENNVAKVLHTMSISLWESLGSVVTSKATVHNSRFVLGFMHSTIGIFTHVMNWSFGRFTSVLCSLYPLSTPLTITTTIYIS